MNHDEPKLGDDGFLRDSRGATFLEYGLLLALIAALAVGSVTLIGSSINTMFTSIKLSIFGP